jgi:hypothetical protein
MGQVRLAENDAEGSCDMRFYYLTSGLPTIRPEPSHSLPTTSFLDTFRVDDDGWEFCCSEKGLRGWKDQAGQGEVDGGGAKMFLWLYWDIWLLVNEEKRGSHGDLGG